MIHTQLTKLRNGALAALLLFCFLYGHLFFPPSPDPEPNCSTDSDCAEKFGYNGDPTPIDWVYVCIHTGHYPPCQHP